MATDRITLTVPARGEFAKTIRIAAAELASRIGMSYDEVEDVRLAAEEAFVYACGCTDETSRVTFEFTLAQDRLGIEVGPLERCCVPGSEHRPEGYTEFILQSICDEFEVSHEAGACLLRLVRCAAARAEDARA